MDGTPGRIFGQDEVWEGRPHHAFRKGLVSGLKRAGADTDAVEVLVGHSLGLRGVYTDPDAIPLRGAVELIPRLPGQEPLEPGSNVVPIRGPRGPLEIGPRVPVVPEPSTAEIKT